MDLSSISSVVQTIGGLLTREVTSLMGVKDKVEHLQRELIWMQSFLKEADARKADNEVVRNSIADIRELAYDAEDVIETFALKVAPRRRGGISNVIKRSACILNEGWLLHQTKCEIEKITTKITKLTQRLQTYDVRKLGDEAGSSSSNRMREMRRPYPHIIDDNVIGLDDDIKKLVSVLVDGGSDCKIVSICGMGGLGKTTLAKKIYRHSRVSGHFDYLAWVYVSQQFQARRVWEDILSALKDLDKEDKKKRDEELAEKLYNFLKDKKCLVILDDIWNIEAWDSLKPVFPVAVDTGSKFVLTSRNKEIISHADRKGYLHELRCLNDEESWELCQKIAFPQVDSRENIIDAKMEELGKQMVHRCAGLPLAIIVLGGILGTKKSVYEWQMVLENLKANLKKGKGKGQYSTEEVLALSYDDLPAYLRPCFLYLSHFPEDYEIPAETLVQLWVAEGIISSEDEESRGGMMEDVAEGWLVELVERCMVQVGERRPTLKIETCRMHDLMRDLCLTIAKKENFLCIIGDPSFSQSNGRLAVRRIVAHKFLPIWSIKSSPLRSILFFGNPFDGNALAEEVLHPKMLNYIEELELEADTDCKSKMVIVVLAIFILWKMQGSWKYLLNNFKLLRVLGFEGFDDTAGCKLPSGISNLIHLRFLNLRGGNFEWQKIPSSLGNLRYLQTLDLRIFTYDYKVCYVPNVIWKLEQLRHLYLPEYMSSKTKLKLHTLTNLLTLVNFNTNNCFLADLSKFKKLRKLKMYRSLNCEDFKEGLDMNLPIITSIYLQFLSIRCSSDDERIDPKLFSHLLSSCVNLCELIIGGQMKKLPEYHHFSSNIIYIRSRRCWLEEDPMPTLEKLPNLRILEFEDLAFTGKEMVCSAPHFPKLESLKFKDLSRLEKWKVEEGAMPALRHLEIRCCPSLKMLPEGLRFITTLQELKITEMRKEFKDKMVEGGEDFYKVQHIPSITFSNILGVE